MATVEVTPSGAVLAAGATVQLHALARDADGRLVTGHRVTWTSSDAGIADVLDTGLVMARAVGQASISATIAGIRGSAGISVMPGVKEPPEDDDKLRLPQ